MRSSTTWCPRFAPITTRAASRYCLSRLQFYQLGRYEPAATISRFAATAFTKRAFPEIGSTIDHLREVLGDEAYEALASTGASMTNAAMTAYALEQIDGVRAELLHEDDVP